MSDIVSESSGDLQQEFHVECPGNGILAVRRNLAESQPAVHRDRVFHDWLDAVEAHPLVSDQASFADDALRQNAPKSFASKLRAQVKPLHFTHSNLEFVKGYASGQLSFEFGKKQTPFRRSIVSGKLAEFLIEILEAETEPQ